MTRPLSQSGDSGKLGTPGRCGCLADAEERTRLVRPSALYRPARDVPTLGHPRLSGFAE
jgi:hypothetical protein